MAFTAAQVTVTTTATALFTGVAAADMWLRPAQSGPTLYVGPAGVTVATGYPVRGEFHLPTPAVGDDVYGVTDHPGGVLVRTLVRPAAA